MNREATEACRKVERRRRQEDAMRITVRRRWRADDQHRGRSCRHQRSHPHAEPHSQRPLACLLKKLGHSKPLSNSLVIEAFVAQPAPSVYALADRIGKTWAAARRTYVR